MKLTLNVIAPWFSSITSSDTSDNEPSLVLVLGFELYLKKANIEFRRGNAGGGNQLRQPYIKKYLKRINLSDFKSVEKVHNFGYYIGNYPSLKIEKIKLICNYLNNFKI